MYMYSTPLSEERKSTVICLWRKSYKLRQKLLFAFHSIRAIFQNYYNLIELTDRNSTQTISPSMDPCQSICMFLDVHEYVMFFNTNFATKEATKKDATKKEATKKYAT